MAWYRSVPPSGPTSDNGYYVNFAGRGRTGDTLRPITPHHSKQGMGYIMAVIRSTDWRFFNELKKALKG
jgi:hypothetical protein